MSIRRFKGSGQQMMTRLQQIATGTPAQTKEVERATPFQEIDEPKHKYHHTEVYTRFTTTDGVTQLLYSAESWVRIRVLLETAGPVAVGTRQEIAPVLSGKGRLLPTGREMELILPKGDRFFIVSESVNRVSWSVEAIPWLQTITLEVRSIGANIVNAISSAIGR